MADATMKRKELETMIKEVAGGEVADQLAKSNEELAKIKEGFGKIGVNFDELDSPEAVDKIKSYINRNEQTVAKNYGIQETAVNEFAIGSLVKSLLLGDGDKVRGIKAIEDSIEIEKKAAFPNTMRIAKLYRAKGIMNSTTLTDGGILVQPEYANEVISLLYGKLVFNTLGARKISGIKGSLNLGKINSGTTAQYRSEMKPIGTSQITLKDLVLAPKSLAVMVPISRELIRNQSIDSEKYIQEDIINSIASKTESQFLYGVGDESSPIGIYNQVSAGHKNASSGTDAASVGLDLINPVKNVSANLKDNISKGGYILNPNQYYSLWMERDDVGGFLYRDELKMGKLVGFNYASTTNNTLESDGKGKIVFGDFDKVVIGEGVSLELARSTDASYVDADGNLVHIYQNNMVLLRAITEHDIKLRYTDAFAFTENVAW